MVGIRASPAGYHLLVVLKGAPAELWAVSRAVAPRQCVSVSAIAASILCSSLHVSHFNCMHVILVHVAFNIHSTVLGAFHKTK